MTAPIAPDVAAAGLAQGTDSGFLDIYILMAKSGLFRDVALLGHVTRDGSIRKGHNPMPLNVTHQHRRKYTHKSYFQELIAFRFSP